MANQNPTPLGAKKQRGRTAGIPNKSTTRAREALTLLMEENVPKMAGWLQECYEKDGPKIALQVMERLLDFHIPRLARQEITGLDGAPVRIIASKTDLDL